MEKFHPSQTIPFSPEVGVNHRKVATFFVVALHLILIPIYLKFGSPIFVIGFLGLLAALGWSLFSIRNTLVLLFCYISFLPNSSWGSRYEFFRGIYFHPMLMIAIAAVILLWVLAETSVRRRTNDRTFSFLDISIITFLVVAAFAASRGASVNANIPVIIPEIIFISCYAFYFLYTRKLKIAEIEWCWRFLLVMSVLVSLQYLMLAQSVGGLSELVLVRVVTQQPHLAQLAFPLCAGYLFFANSRSTKIVALVGIFLLIPMIFLSQQRALWVGVVFSTFLLFAFAFFKDGFSLKMGLKFLFYSVAGLALLVIALFVIDRIFTGSVIFTLMSRIGSMASLSTDLSANVRLSEINRALAYWQSSLPNLLFGTGLGSSYEATDPGRPFGLSVDSSFAFILWKLGLAGLVSFTALMISFLKRGLYVFRHAVLESHRQLTAALLAGMSGLLVIGLTNTSLILYRFIIIWALALATVEVLYRKTKHEQTKRTGHKG